MYANVKFRVIKQLKDYPYIKITRCNKFINTKTNKFLSYTQRGYFINGKYYKRKDLNPMIEKIPSREYNPFGIRNNFLNQF